MRRELLVEAEFAQVGLRPLRRRGDLAVDLATRADAPREPRTVAKVHLAPDLRRERVHDEVADERVVHRLAVVAAAEVLVAIVDLEVADAERRVLHDAVEEWIVDRRLVD